MPGAPDYPEPTKEERQLQSEQAALLTQQRDILQEQLRQQQLLAPILFKEAGLVPQYDESGTITGFEQGPPTPEQRLAEQQLQLASMTLPHSLRSAGLEAQYDEAGNLTGVTETAGAQQRRQIEEQLNQRTLDALAGNLPVDPALERNLTEGRATLGEALAKQLGPGFETSTPGIEALAEYDKRAEELRYGARTGQLTLGEQLSLAEQANKRDTISGLLQTIQGPFPGLSAQGATAGTLGQYAASVREPFALGSGGTLGDLARSYGGLTAPLATQRQGQYVASQQQQQYNTQAGTGLGALLGGVLGTFVFPGVGTAAGATLGGAAGGLAGRSY